MDVTRADALPERRISILLLVVAAHERMGRLVERELAADGIAAADYAFLSLVGLRGPARLTEVAGELGMPLTTASDAVRRLEARGHTRRAPNPGDGRSVLVELTEAGEGEWRRGWPALRRINEQLSEALDDPDLVRTGLERLGRAFDEIVLVAIVLAAATAASAADGPATVARIQVPRLRSRAQRSQAGASCGSACSARRAHPWPEAVGAGRATPARRTLEVSVPAARACGCRTGRGTPRRHRTGAAPAAD